MPDTPETTHVKPGDLPPIQVIANLVVVDADSRVLLVKYEPEADRWWLPGGDLEPYEDPLDAAERLLSEFPDLETETPELSHVESFRGRRGWHVVLHYRVRAKEGGSGTTASALPTAWHALDDFPRTAHGRWERDAARTALG